MSKIRCEEGVSTRERIAVTSDALDITKRIKEIDPDYFIMLNRQTDRFEVHVRGQEMTLGCELPFDTLDARTLEYVREHKAARIGEILREMEREDARREAAGRAEMEEIHERAAEGMRYLANKRTTDELPDELTEGIGNDAQGDVQLGGRVHRPQRRLCNHQKR